MSHYPTTLLLSWRACMLNHVGLLSIPRTEAHQDLQSMGFSRKSTRVGSHSLLQGIFLIQVLKLCLLYCLHCKTGSLPLSHREAHLTG